MRDKFVSQLDTLNDNLTSMCNLCQQAIENSVKALFVCADNNQKYEEIAQLVYDTDREIDDFEREIEGLCMRLLLQQQPVATDLRRISSALKMISDLERIGDQASDITELSEYIRSCSMEYKLHLKEMSRVVIRMVKKSISSYINHDINEAYAVIEMDNEVDALFDEVKSELISIITDEEADAELCIDLLMVSKYFERIADHAENIAEWVEYSITGFHRKDK